MVLESLHQMERKKWGKEEQGSSAHALIASGADNEVRRRQGRGTAPKERIGEMRICPPPAAAATAEPPVATVRAASAAAAAAAAYTDLGW